MAVNATAAMLRLQSDLRAIKNEPPGGQTQGVWTWTYSPTVPATTRLPCATSLSLARFISTHVVRSSSHCCPRCCVPALNACACHRGMQREPMRRQLVPVDSHYLRPRRHHLGGWVLSGRHCLCDSRVSRMHSPALTARRVVAQVASSRCASPLETGTPRSLPKSVSQGRCSTQTVGPCMARTRQAAASTFVAVCGQAGLLAWGLGLRCAEAGSGMRTQQALSLWVHHIFHAACLPRSRQPVCPALHDMGAD